MLLCFTVPSVRFPWPWQNSESLKWMLFTLCMLQTIETWKCNNTYKCSWTTVQANSSSQHKLIMNVEAPLHIHGKTGNLSKSLDCLCSNSKTHVKLNKVYINNKKGCDQPQTCTGILTERKFYIWFSFNRCQSFTYIIWTCIEVSFEGLNLGRKLVFILYTQNPPTKNDLQLSMNLYTTYKFQFSYKILHFHLSWSP